MYNISYKPIFYIGKNMIYYKTYEFDPDRSITDEEKQIVKQTRDFLLEHAFELDTGIPFSAYDVKLNRYSKPEINNEIHFNISHTRGLACCAIASHPIGIDAELIKPVNIKLTDKVCSLKEKECIRSSDNTSFEFLKYWTLKESYIKKIGMGLSFPMNKINFDIKVDSIESNADNEKFYIKFINNYVLALCRDANDPNTDFELIKL